MRKLLLLIPLALVLSACGGTSGGTNSPNQGHLGEVAGLNGTTLTLILKDFTITPENVTLPKTGAYTVVIWNEGSVLHSLKIQGNGLSAKAKEINFGEKASFKVTFAKPGKYTMYCPIDGHKDLGMTGTITVG
jgi:FtsP/CotA-like multicopper oxidase with cupredoxin domain